MGALAMKTIRNHLRSILKRHALGMVCAILLWMPGSVFAQSSAPPSPAAGRIGAILPIHDALTDVTVTSLRRRIEDAQDQGATVFVFELNTPGGLVSSAISISDLIKGIPDAKTVAWVNTNAHSGGAMVALACHEIVMARSSRIGDSQVIMVGPEGVTAIPDDLKPKANTPVLGQFRASARERGYSEVLAESFVIPEREVWWLEHVPTGQRQFFFTEEKEKLIPDEDSTTESSSSKSDGPPTEWRLVEKYYDTVLERDVDVMQPIERSDTLLEMSASEAIAYGFSKGVVTTEAELRSRYELEKVIRYAPSWSEQLAFWLTSEYVRGFLMVIILMGAYVEFHTPGLGLAGLVALIALGIFIGAPYMTGLANIWEILFVIGGIVLILLEILVIPGTGIAGISGVVLLVIGMLATFAPPEPGRTIPLYIPTMESTVEGVAQGLKILVISLVISLAGMFMLSRFLPRMPVLRGMIPANPTPSEVQVDDPYLGAARVGDLGESLGPLRPAGKARFGPMYVDVVTQGEFIESGTALEVVERRGNRVVVRAARG
jgi:membrane-bound serine protease (ClpP class)